MWRRGTFTAHLKRESKAHRSWLLILTQYDTLCVSLLPFNFTCTRAWVISPCSALPNPPHQTQHSKNKHLWYFQILAPEHRSESLGPWRSPGLAAAKTGEQWACADRIWSLAAWLVTDINSWRYWSAELRYRQSTEGVLRRITALCTEIWEAEEGLVGKGKESRIYQVFRYALQLFLIFHWIV